MLDVIDVRNGEVKRKNLAPFLPSQTPDMRVNVKLEPHMPLEVKVTQQAQYFNVKIFRRRVVDLKNTGGGNRGAITAFSQESRKRMLDTIAKIDRKKIAWGRHKPKFVTLTYKNNENDYKKAKRDLKVFIERMQERFEDFSCLWRMENQERGAIHFHLLIFGMPFMLVNSSDPAKETMQRHWNEVSGQTANNSLDLRANLRSINGVMWYVAKYMAKEENDSSSGSDDGSCAHGENVSFSQYDAMATVNPPFLGLSMPHIFSKLKSFTGRWWGVYGRKNFPWGDKREFQRVVTLQTMRDLRHVIGGPWARSTVSYTIFGGWVADVYDVFVSIYWQRKEENRRAQRIFREKREFARKTWATHGIALAAAHGYTPNIILKFARLIREKNCEKIELDPPVDSWWDLTKHEQMLLAWNASVCAVDVSS